MMQRFRTGPGSFDGARDDRPALVGNRDRSVAVAWRREGDEMQDEPTPTELIKAVADFLRNEITPAIKGHNAFKLRVGINALDLVTRQLTLAAGERRGGSCAAEAVARRRRLADRPQSRAGGQDRQRRGRSADAGAVPEHLWQTTMDKLAVDQPNYASYKREERGEISRQSLNAVIPGCALEREPGIYRVACQAIVAPLQGWPDLSTALAKTTRRRSTAMRATLGGLPLAMSRS